MFNRWIDNENALKIGSVRISMRRNFSPRFTISIEEPFGLSVNWWPLSLISEGIQWNWIPICMRLCSRRFLYSLVFFDISLPFTPPPLFPLFINFIFFPIIRLVRFNFHFIGIQNYLNFDKTRSLKHQQLLKIFFILLITSYGRLTCYHLP